MVRWGLSGEGSRRGVEDDFGDLGKDLGTGLMKLSVESSPGEVVALHGSESMFRW